MGSWLMQNIFLANVNDAERLEQFLRLPITQSGFYCFFPVVRIGALWLLILIKQSISSILPGFCLVNTNLK